jgi:hypothetical protein
MVNRKSLLWFLIIAFGFSWILFTLPLAFKNSQTSYLASMQISFALAMWGPGIAAIVTTLFVDKQSFKTLRLNTLGPKRFYLWAWFLPPVLTLATLGFSILIRSGDLDSNLSMMREALKQVPSTAGLPPVEMLVAIQLAFAVTLAPFCSPWAKN